MIRTLVIDDEELVRRSLVRLLERNGHSCIQAEDATAARSAFSSRDFDLVLCDIIMPGESGLDFVQQLLSEHPETAIIMVTGVDDPAQAGVAIETGVYGYIVKPFRRNEVLINVDNALRRRRLEVENRLQRHQLVETVRDRTADLWNSVRQVERADNSLRSSIEEMVRRLSMAAEVRDFETAGHIERMSSYAGFLAGKMGLEPERCAQIHLASRLHDVGKISIPDRVLQKKGRFSEADHEVMKQHSEVGYRLLTGTNAGLLDLAADIALTHHERWDGRGYPKGLAGEAIPIEGRIAAVADCFDALSSKRSYKPAFPLGQVVEIMREGRGTQFDPRVLDLFLDSLNDVMAIAHDLQPAVAD
ncbi:MAG: HD domain-containing phosphohydrolase [Actinomycetota bacterium]